MTSSHDEPIVDPAVDDQARYDPASDDHAHDDHALDDRAFDPPTDPALEPVPDAGFDDPDDDLFEDSFQAPKRTNRLTVVLVVALLMVAGFAGGVLVQKHHDVGIAATAAGIPRRAGGGQGNGQGGGQGGGRGASSTAAPGAGGGDGAAGGAGAGGGADAAGGPPVVTGTVRTVEDGAIEVTDPTGAVVRVFVPATATVTTLGLSGLKFNTPVSVAGTKEVDGSVQATSVTVRAPGS